MEIPVDSRGTGAFEPETSFEMVRLRVVEVRVNERTFTFGSDRIETVCFVSGMLLYLP